jgi:hypothetical protein
MFVTVGMDRSEMSIRKVGLAQRNRMTRAGWLVARSGCERRVEGTENVASETVIEIPASFKGRRQHMRGQCRFRPRQRSAGPFHRSR